MLKNMKVYLRALEVEDYQTSIAWRQDQQIWNMVVGRRYFVSSEFEKKWVQQAGDLQGQLKLAICDVLTDNYIGNIYLSNIDFFNRTANSGKLIGNKAYWGKGFGTHATLLLLYHAFYDLGLERIESRVLLHNQASIRVLEKCGYKAEGVMRKAVFKQGRSQDLVLMSVIREDYDEVMRIYQ